MRMRRLCNALMTTTENATAWPDHKPTALLVLADGTALEGFGLGAEGQAVGEVCFNTAMTGYEEILTDPSYAGQLITFTFPHIGNVGTNDDDIETVNMAATPGARGVILRAAIDYGIKRNILRLLAGEGCKITVVPATTSAEDILAMKPDGVFLSNGPGDPAETGKYAVPVIQKVIDSGTPTFGICLGHQMLGLAVGAKTMKMHQGHHGANHPVKDETTGKVEITSMNHGFAVDQATLPIGATQTHISLFDGSNCGIQLDGKPVLSVQYHPEASPGPRDSHYLFKRFADLMRANKRA